MRYYLISDSRDALTGMRLAGIEGTFCQTREAALEAIGAAQRDPEIGILLLTDTLAALCPDEVQQLRMQESRPLVVEIPGSADAQRSGAPLLDVIQDAIGFTV